MIRLYCRRPQLHNSVNTEAELVLTLEPPPLWTNIYGTGRYYASYQRRKVNTHSTTKPLIYNNVLPARCTSVIEQLTNQYLILFKAHCMGWNLSPTLLRLP